MSDEGGLPPGRTFDLGRGVVAVVAENPGPLTLDGTRTYVIGSSRPIVLDPGPADSRHLERIERVLGERDVEAVCLTHAHSDHSGGAPEAAHLGPLRASAATLERLDLPGRPLQDGDEIGAGEVRLRALATPGHSADHLCYWVPGSGDLFTGDLVLGEGSSMVAWPDGSVADYLASLERLAGLSPARLLPGHGPPVENAVEKLREYASHRAQRTQQVIAALDAGAESLDDLRERVYGELPPGVIRAAELSLLAHVAHIARTGRRLPTWARDALA